VKSVFVIGGGFAGLSAATALAESGVPVTVVEARPTLGGRANTFRDPVTGERIDNGQHVLAGCYDETLRFLRRIGSSHLLHWPSSLRVPIVDEGGRASELVLPPLPAPFDLAAAAFAWDALTGVDWVAMVRISRAIRGRAPVDRSETVRQWLQRNGQTDRLCRLLWEPLALAALNQSIDQAAAASFVAVTSRMFSGEPHASTLLIPAVPLDELYVLPSLGFLRDHGAVVIAGRSASVRIADGRVTHIRTGHDSVPAEVVVSAVPWFALNDVLPPDGRLSELRATAAATQSSPIVTVNLWFDAYKPSETFLGLPGRTFQWAFARGRIIGAQQSHLSLVSSGAEAICNGRNDDLIAIAEQEIRDAIPALRSLPLGHANVVRERRATFSLHPASPPRPQTVTPIDGLFLAGDWIDTGLPATIESAVVSGHRAAQACLQSLRTTRR
jgi:squalene-associated FAD-dependent desaturase